MSDLPERLGISVNKIVIKQKRFAKSNPFDTIQAGDGVTFRLAGQAAYYTGKVAARIEQREDEEDGHLIPATLFIMLSSKSCAALKQPTIKLEYSQIGDIKRLYVLYVVIINDYTESDISCNAIGQVVIHIKGNSSYQRHSQEFFKLFFGYGLC